MRRLLRRVGGLACLTPGASYAHSFGTPYILPIPFWMYAYGCAATLVVTFAAAAFFAGAARAKIADLRGPRRAKLTWLLSPWGVWLLRASSAGSLLLTILAGLIGTTDAGQNIGMTLFWVIFLLGFTYLTLFVGNLYALINPWKWGIEGLERLGFDLSRSRVRYSPYLGYWPAFLGYIALIWLELFVGLKPAVLAIALIIYSAATFTGIALYGKAIWFARADSFSVLFRLIGRLAPMEYRSARDGTSWRVLLRPPFVGALEDRPEHLSLVLFVLLVLSSTSYDAIHDTAFWTGLYWKNLLWLLQPVWGSDLGRAQSLLMGGYLAYRQVGLLVFPFLYFGCYVLVLLCASALAAGRISWRTLALGFCYPLVPIAVAYHFTHYYTFLITQIHNLPRLISDPFGWGWDLFGIRQNYVQPALPMAVVWHTQVAVLVFGHIISVYLAHQVALKVFPTRHEAITSQLPLLVLMVVYTMLGLWILSLPLGSSPG